MNLNQLEEIGNLTAKEFDELYQELESERLRTNEEKERIQIQNELDDLLYYRCATDVELFSITFFPHYCTEEFNDFHEDLFTRYKYGERGVRRGRGAPRGYAKSTISAFIKPLHDLCYELERFIVIISNTEPQAKQKLKDIRAEIIDNDFLTHFYGLGFQGGKAGETDFIACNGNYEIRFLALGSGTEIRGIRFGAFRPSKVVLDDIEHSTKVFNESIRDSFEDWFNDVVTKIGNKETNIEIVGTILHPKALLVKILKNPLYDGKLFKAVESWAERKDLWNQWENILTNIDNINRQKDANEFYAQNKPEMDRGTKVLWPEKEPYVYLMQELVETGKRSFMKEKQNSPLSDDECVFDIEDFKWYQEQKDGILIEHNDKFIPYNEMRYYGALDPSTGQQTASRNKKGDYACVLSGFSDRHKRLFVHHDITKRLSPTKQIGNIFDNNDVREYEKFAVEENLYRNLLLNNILDERKRREDAQKKKIRVPFYEIINTENKTKRIFTLEPKINHGWILFNRNLSNTFMDMFFEFPKGDHDDGPDALEMLWNLVNGRYDKNAVAINPMVGR